VRAGVLKCTNHEPKVKLGRLVKFMPPSERREFREAIHRLNGSTRVPGGAFGKNERLRVPFDPRPALKPAEMKALAARRRA
jgi:hypothetical protein